MLNRLTNHHSSSRFDSKYSKFLLQEQYNDVYDCVSDVNLFVLTLLTL